MDYPTTDDEVAPFVRSIGAPGIIDIHVHAFPERLQQAIWRYFDRLDPAWPITYRWPLAERLAHLRRLGVRQHTALAYAHKPALASALNDFTMGLADEHAQVIPTFTIFPDADVAQYVETALHRGGQVCKVHVQVSKYRLDEPVLSDVWSQLERARVPIVLHASVAPDGTGGEAFCGPDVVADLLERHPDLVVVLAHLGAPDVEGFLRLAESTPGMHLDLSMALTEPAYLGQLPDHLMPRLAALWPRLVFGSDFPTIPSPFAAQVLGLRWLELGPTELRAVLHDNAAGLLSRVRA